MKANNDDDDDDDREKGKKVNIRIFCGTICQWNTQIEKTTNIFKGNGEKKTGTTSVKKLWLLATCRE